MVYTTASRRKLVKQGSSTLTVSMPADWLRLNGLQAGDEVVLEETEQGIVIIPEASHERVSTTEIDVSGYSDTLLHHALHALHKRGFDEIRMTCKDAQLPLIRKTITESLIGYEIVEQQASVAIIRSVMRTDPEELRILTRRAFLVTLSLAEGLGRQGNADALISLEQTNNRLTNYCERLIIRSGGRNPSAIFQYIIVWLLEKVADEYRDLARKNVDPEAVSLTRALLKQVYSLYYSYDAKEHGRLLEDLHKAEKRLGAHDDPLANVVRILQQTTGSLISLNLHESAQS